MHFSKFIRPDAKRIGLESTNKDIMTTAIKNKDGSIVVVILNMTEQSQPLSIELNSKVGNTLVEASALQTILIQPE